MQTEDNFMEVPVAEATATYLATISNNISKVCLDSPYPYLELMRTKGLKRFVPTDWTGMRGDDLVIDLQTTPDLPTEIQAKARPINPRLFGPTKIEFDRLEIVVLEPSTSPYCAPIVVAP